VTEKNGVKRSTLGIIGKKGDSWNLYRTIGRTNPNISNKQINAIVDHAKVPTTDRVLFVPRLLKKTGKVLAKVAGAVVGLSPVSVPPPRPAPLPVMPLVRMVSEQPKTVAPVAKARPIQSNKERTMAAFAAAADDTFDPVIDRLTKLVGWLQEELNRLKGINPRDEGLIVRTWDALKAAKAELEKEQRGKKAKEKERAKPRAPAPR
jgi:hypothetical protein